MKTILICAALVATSVQAQETKDIVDIAVGSQDHTTLVAALKAADLVTALKNPGPLTVFAPTNAAFEKLPKGTLDTLLKPENVGQLQKILQYHVTPATYEAKSLKNGQVLGQANGGKVKVSVKGGKVTLNGNAHVLASIRASNGIVHVIDEVLLPPAEAPAKGK